MSLIMEPDMFGLIDIGVWALLLAALVFLASAVVFAVAWRSRRDAGGQEPPDRDSTQRERDASWHQQVHSILSEAQAIVDLTTPAGEDLEQPSTSTLSTVSKRLDRLDQRLHRLSIQPCTTKLSNESRVKEAILDLERVGTSLGSALDAERALRIGVGSTARTRDDRVQSLQRITQRSAELDLAADELCWLADEGE